MTLFTCSYIVVKSNAGVMNSPVIVYEIPSHSESCSMSL